MTLVNRRGAMQIGLTGTVAAYALARYPNLVLAEPVPQVEATPEFIWLSNQLIGVKEEWINPTVPQDGIRLCDLYYSAFRAKADESSFTSFSQEIAGHYYHGMQLPDDLLVGAKNKPSTTVLAWGARMTMMMWLFGGWYAGTEIQRIKSAYGTNDQPAPNDDPNVKTIGLYFKLEANETIDNLKDEVLSSRAYANGWIWRIAQAHPMGVSQFAFGSWAEVPPMLVDYGFDLTT